MGSNYFAIRLELDEWSRESMANQTQLRLADLASSKGTPLKQIRSISLANHFHSKSMGVRGQAARRLIITNCPTHLSTRKMAERNRLNPVRMANGH